jgi:hypothetical protein
MYTLAIPHKKKSNVPIYIQITYLNHLYQYTVSRFTQWLSFDATDYSMQSEVRRIYFEYVICMSLEIRVRVGGCVCTCLPFFLPSRLQRCNSPRNFLYFFRVFVFELHFTPIPQPQDLHN